MLRLFFLFYAVFVKGVITIDEFYNVKQISKMFDVCEEQVRRWIREGKMVGECVSKKQGYRVSRTELDNFTNRSKYCSNYDIDSLIELRLRSDAIKQCILNLLREYMKLNKLIKELESENQ